ncbi:glyoxalase-like domain protein [Bordetella hinzii CA90 BAL1384]|uniref:VOC family protein n=1 Tax=Bordetella hinzii TaxID=103855 RepID=UPI00045B5B4A|nr:VOC family protein [Bordetella hinzii]KCB27998.1 glyoxalase-like domain protein [Bordetella hinzii CA90 BAL1384]QWF38595.1 drug:proton antiporter [Bordetella hinzii]QWF43140.1 drug:proton antiporter [Bordetella hinzii]QWF47681.1 drug:proton antiporter [Bordetella hinzii]QWF52216.1 drug:proton antiporter [Bordetella hinzii]
MLPSYTLLYVDAARTSAAFYEKLLGLAPVELSDDFALFALEGGAKLGLWSRATVQPLPRASAGGVELGIAVGAPADVDRCFEAWRERGVPIVQAPCQMEFGRTFVGLDPDGHRLRVFAPAG